jgi:hypothetical protein
LGVGATSISPIHAASARLPANVKPKATFVRTAYLSRWVGAEMEGNKKNFLEKLSFKMEIRKMDTW